MVFVASKWRQLWQECSQQSQGVWGVHQKDVQLEKASSRVMRYSHIETHPEIERTRHREIKHGTMIDEIYWNMMQIYLALGLLLCCVFCGFKMKVDVTCFPNMPSRHGGWFWAAQEDDESTRRFTTWDAWLGRKVGTELEQIICAMVKSRYIGDGHPTFNRNPYNGCINPYYWVDDHPLLYGNNGSFDPGTFENLQLHTFHTNKWRISENLTPKWANFIAWSKWFFVCTHI